MKKLVVLTILLSLSFVGFVQAADESHFVLPITEAYIKYERLGCQNYEFWVVGNLSEAELKYEWSVDNKELYNTSSIRSFLSRGEHVVKVKVEDNYGNVIYDNVRLNIRFWSLQNNWFWWLLYLLIVLVIAYYWVVKIIYLFNRRKVSKDVRVFMDILDDHGWVEKIIAHHVKEKKKTLKKKKASKKISKKASK